MLRKTKKEDYLIDIAIPNNQNLYSTTTTTKKPHKHTDLKEEITSIWQLSADYIVILVLYTTDFIPKDQERQYTYKVILRCVRTTTVTVEIQ
jgi:hypothetical protein